MLRTTETAIIDTPVNILMGKVLSNQHHIYSKALESLAFTHPYKNFFVLVYKDSTETDAKIHHIKVYDYGIEVAHMTYYIPESDTRNKTQLQVRYNYEVQNKNPRDCKRSSDLRKIEQMILAIKPAELSHCDTKESVYYTIQSCIKTDDKINTINYMSRDIYYANNEEQMKIWTSIFAGNDLVIHARTGKSYRELFTEAKTAYEEGKAEAARYLKHAVTVHATPTGKYRVFNYKEVNGVVDKWIEDYDNLEALPEEVSGQMAVLQIAESSESREYYYTRRPSGGCSPITVDGVGMIHGDLYNMYTMIGGDFRDTRSQSQVEGS